MTGTDFLSHRDKRGARRGMTASALAAAALFGLLAGCSAQSDAPTANRQTEEVAPNTAAQRPASGAAIGSSARDRPVLAIEGEGLRLFDRESGIARPLAFGLGRAQLMNAVKFLGRAETGRLPDCGPGPLEHASWPGGLTLYFQHNRFAGWAVRSGDEGAAPVPVVTAANIGLGSTRAELERAYETEVFDSSLGTEFAAGKLAGILDGPGAQSRITHLWAGASCVMR